MIHSSKPVTAIVSVAAAALLLVFAVVATPAAAVVPGQWSTPATLSAPGFDGSNPQIATDGTTITAIWAEKGPDNTQVIQASHSSDEGTTWSGAVDVSNPSDTSSAPQLVSANGVVTAVWSTIETNNVAIESAFSRDAGATWSTPIVFSNAGTDSTTPQLLKYGADVFAVWTARTPAGFEQIQSAISTDDGATWSAVVPISNSGASGNDSATSPEAVIVGTGIVVAWSLKNESTGLNIIQESSSADGLAWSTPIDLSTLTASFNVDLATDGTRVTAIWQDSAGPAVSQIQESTSDDRGATWPTAQTISPSGQNATTPRVVTNGETITTSWLGPDGSSTPRMLSSLSKDGGTTWTSPVYVSAAGGAVGPAPELVTDGNTVTAAWYRFDGTVNVIQSSSSTNAGATWSTPVNVSQGENTPAAAHTPTLGKASEPEIATDGTTLTIEWLNNDGLNNRVQVASMNPVDAPTLLVAVSTVTTRSAGAVADGMTLDVSDTATNPDGVWPVYGSLATGFSPVPVTITSDLWGPFGSQPTQQSVIPAGAKKICEVTTVVTAPGQYVTTPSCAPPTYAGFYVWTEQTTPSATPVDEGRAAIAPQQSDFGIPSETQEIPGLALTGENVPTWLILLAALMIVAGAALAGGRRASVRLREQGR